MKFKVKSESNTEHELISNSRQTRRGWCPRTGKGQQLMVKEAISEYIWFATCQGKIYENKPPSATHETI